jgi:signal transduction histidine kinase
LASSSYLRSTLTYTGVALAAGSFAVVLWLAGFLTPLQQVFVFLPKSHEAMLLVPNLWTISALIFASSLMSAMVVGRFGGRRAFPYLGAGFLLLSISSLAASWLFSMDIVFTPIFLAGAFSAAIMQTKRLREQDLELTDKLIESTHKLGNLQATDPEQRLRSGLKLLDTVLAPRDAIVFRRDANGRLIFATRLRMAQENNLDTERNTVWRGGVGLCERAMLEKEIIVERIEGQDIGTNIALPLRHEDRIVGTLLVRLTREFEDDDRALLTAIGGQLARNLQGEDSQQSMKARGPLDFFSSKAIQQKLDSLYVLNGVLLEQRVGVNALADISDGVALGYLDGRIAYANSTLLASAGLSEAETRDLCFFDLLDRFRTDIFDEPAIAVRRVLQTGDAYERELTFADRNETLRLRISLVLDEAATRGMAIGEELNGTHSGAQPLCLALVIKDVTRTKEYEELKSDMISLMSHEMRTPLTSINGFAQLLTADEELPEQAKEFVTIIANESQRLSRMINTFLAVTELQRKDRQEVLKIPLRLDEVVRETVASLQPIAKKRRIRLVEQPTPSLPPVAADKSMITQAVKNLVSNAIKYSPERTTVTVSTALEAEAVRLSVEDRGYGIPAEAKDRVWEKFYRVVREGQEKDEESTGLGLSFVRQVVEQHGGSVDLESEVGRGSTFSFTLPRL